MKNNIYKQILILFFLFLFVQFVGINVTGEELIESSSQVVKVGRGSDSINYNCEKPDRILSVQAVNNRQKYLL